VRELAEGDFECPSTFPGVAVGLAAGPRWWSAPSRLAGHSRGDAGRL
jgi:hypothetical protein